MSMWPTVCVCACAAFYFSGIALQATLNKEALKGNPILRESSGANLDMQMEIQLARALDMERQRLECDTKPSDVATRSLPLIDLLCVLKIAPDAADQDVCVLHLHSLCLMSVLRTS